MKTILYSMSEQALHDWLACDPETCQPNAPQPKMRAQQVFEWVYKRHVLDFNEMTNLPKSLRTTLQDHFELKPLTVVNRQVAEDMSVKTLWRLQDGKTVESVLMISPNDGKKTLCLSSQVGCAMACSFCLTGVQGFDRHLQSGEIVAQVMQTLTEYEVDRLVFMGMGEPLHNLDQVVAAIHTLTSQNTLNFASRRITVSTAGIVPAIKELGEQTRVRLAVSLNASHDEQREAIMPVNKKWPIGTLLKALRDYPQHAYHRVTLEYVLIRDFNDLPQDAVRLAKKIKNDGFKVNLIPYNEHPGSKMKRPTEERIDDFHKTLVEYRITSTVRRSKGYDVLGACGQLRSQHGTAKGTDRHVDTEYKQA